MRDPFFFFFVTIRDFGRFWSISITISKRIGEKRSFLIRLFMHEYITSAQTLLNAEPFYEFVPQLRFFFVTQHISGSRRGNAEHPFVSDTILHPRPLSTTILFISKLQMLTASHYPSLCLITNASYIVIIA